MTRTNERGRHSHLCLTSFGSAVVCRCITSYGLGFLTLVNGNCVTSGFPPPVRFPFLAAAAEEAVESLYGSSWEGMNAGCAYDRIWWSLTGAARRVTVRLEYPVMEQVSEGGGGGMILRQVAVHIPRTGNDDGIGEGRW